MWREPQTPHHNDIAPGSRAVMAALSSPLARTPSASSACAASTTRASASVGVIPAFARSVAATLPSVSRSEASSVPTPPTVKTAVSSGRTSAGTMSGPCTSTRLRSDSAADTRSSVTPLTRASNATWAEPGGLLRTPQTAVASAILVAPSLRARCCRRNRNASTCLRVTRTATPSALP
jgi:hypothetical protein